MSGRGRPLRFLALVGVGWIGARVGLVWIATGSLPQAVRAVSPFAAKRVTETERSVARRAVVAVRPIPRPRPVAIQPVASRRSPQLPDRVSVQFALLGLVQYGEPQPVMPAPNSVRSWAADTGQDTPFAVTPPVARWTGSAWMVARPGQGIGAAPGAGQLGGSQAGMRIVYDLVPAARIALAGRVTAPLRGIGAEASLGLEWQPVARLPVRLVAAQRVALKRGFRGGPEVGVLAGTDTSLSGTWRVEAYAQAGAISRARIEPYADGAARAISQVATRGGVRLSLGAGAWGAVQRDAGRLDVGPSAVLGIPAGARQFRVAVDWRQRIAGDARPGSGLALTLGADF